MRWKIADYITSNYSHIVVGKISTKEICEKNELNDLSKATINILSLYELRKTIKYYALRKGCKYMEVDEPYTTIACGKCTNIHKNLKNKKIYECIKCGIKCQEMEIQED